MLHICPVCESKSYLYDVVDFNKNCEEIKGKFLEKSGIPIYYAICSSCNFLFAPEFLNWTDTDFSSNVYNDKYIDVDPDYVNIRPRQNFDLINRYFGKYMESIAHLDYGGGAGYLSKELNAAGWKSTNYDPFSNSDHHIDNLGFYNFITAFEVFEHIPNPHLLMNNLTNHFKNDGIIFFSTLINDGNINLNERLNWWYASPRNGHVSLFSKRSLEILGERYGLNFASLGVGYHIYFKQFPSWGSALLG